MKYDVCREKPYQKTDPSDYPVYLYSGSGRSGACFDEYGLMNQEFISWVNSSESANTVWMHADHYVRGNYGMDQHVPVGRLRFEAEPPKLVGEYHQHLCLDDGKLETEFETEKIRYQISSQFNPEQRDLLYVQVKMTGNELPRRLVFDPQTILHLQYENHLRGTAQSELIEKDLCRIRIRISETRTTVFIKLVSQSGTTALETTEDGKCKIIPQSGGDVFHLLMGTCASAREDYLLQDMMRIQAFAAYAEECSAAWKKRWGNANISIPDKQLEAFWYRSIYILLCSYSPDSDCIGPANGWTGNGWGFHFPQDFSYIIPALLRLGHFDIVKAKMEFYRKALEGVKKTTRRVYGLDGAMWCWEFPIHPEFELYQDAGTSTAEITGTNAFGVTYESPNDCQFEIHNAAYPARMAYETALYLKDLEWAKNVAWPIIRECANFYNAALSRKENGRWGIAIRPSMGQDENGGFNDSNYLCSLFSAQYTLKTAVAAAEWLAAGDADQLASWKEKLADGLAYDVLESKSRGIYLSCEGLAKKDVLSELKHPVMLNPAIFLPLEEKVDDHLLRAYQMKEDICPATKKNYSPGWTLAAFWLAASHLDKGDDMLRYMKQMHPYQYTDKEDIQITESSGLKKMQYYTTSHGLYLQALTDAILRDYYGETEVGRAIPSAWDRVVYQNLYTRTGCHSGEIYKTAKQQRS